MPTRRSAAVRTLLAAASCALLLPAHALAAVSAYVTNSNADSVSVINTLTGLVTDTFSVGDAPYGVATRGTGAYITNAFSDNVYVIDTTDNQLVKTVTVGQDPYGIAVSGTGVYVANSGDDTVSVIDVTSNAVERTISVGDGAYGVVASGTGVFITNDFAGTVSVIDAPDNAVVRTVTVGGGPLGLAVSGTGVYVANSSDDTVTLFDTVDYVSRTIAVGDGPQSVTIRGTGAYVPNYIGDSLSVIDTTSNAVEKTIASVGDGPRNLAVHGTKGYVPNDSGNNVAVISLLTNAVTGTISVGSSPYGIAMTPDTETEAPTLIAPASSSTIGSSLRVAYTLPEFPFPSTVRLNFNDGAGHSVTFTLTDVTSADFTLNLLSPFSSPNVVSVSAGTLPDATYTVTLSYQDNLANTASSATATNVRLSTVVSSSSAPASEEQPTEDGPRAGGVRKETLEQRQKNALPRLSGTMSPAAPVIRSSAASSRSSSAVYRALTPLQERVCKRVRGLRERNAGLAQRVNERVARGWGVACW